MKTNIGHSRIKDVYNWQLFGKEKKVVVKHFSRSTTEDMKTYIQPPLKRDLDRVIIYLDTNELRSGQEPVIIAKNIIDIVKTSTTNKSSIFL